MVDRQTGCRVHYDYFSLAWARQKTKRNFNVGHLSVYWIGVFLAIPFSISILLGGLSYLFFFFFLFFGLGADSRNVQHAIELTRERNHICAWENRNE
jgi:hypothetical protein